MREERLPGSSRKKKATDRFLFWTQNLRQNVPKTTSPTETLGLKALQMTLNESFQLKMEMICYRRTHVVAMKTHQKYTAPDCAHYQGAFD